MNKHTVAEVVYLLPHDEGFHATVAFTPGQSADELLEASGVFKQFPVLLKTPLKLGVFGESISGHYLVNAGDRIEIYRPLQIDPKAARRRRLKKPS